VIPAEFDYLRPTSIVEALELMSLHPQARFLAGGHALIPESKLRRTRPSTLIDLGGIVELRRFETVDGTAASPAGRRIRFGAMTTSADIEYSAAIARAAPLLPQAAAVISDPLIRNRATLGGSIAAADPHGDWPPVVVAADATMHLRGHEGERAVSADDFFATDGTGSGTGATAMLPGELLTAITVPRVDAQTRCVYLKRMHPASGHAMLGVAVSVTVDTDGICRTCRIAIAGARATATRAIHAEAQLVGSDLSAEAIQRAASVANDGIDFVGDTFGSAAYLAAVLPVYLSRALTRVASA
jgi:carbon-monoxide dehydrogenase medium subunit